MDAAPTKPSLSKKPSPSFRLRNGSLNSLRLRRVFDLFDRNGDGKITRDEMESALDTLGLGLGADRASLEATVSAYTLAGAAGFGFDDFESLHRALSDALFGPIVEDVKEAFRAFDEDGDGFISAAELQTVLMKNGVYDLESQLAHFVAAGRSKGQLASKLLFLSKASTYIGVFAGIQQPAYTASFFASHQSVYYGLVAVVMAAVPVEVATAFWLPRSRSPRFHAFAEILYHAGVFVLVVAAAIGGFQITHKA